MSSTLRASAVRGAAWGIAGQALSLALNFGGLLILARLLDKREFGLAGMVFIVSGLLGVGADLGMTVVAVQRRGADQERAARLALGAGAALMLLVLLLAPLFALAFPGAPDGLVPLLRTGAPLLLLAGAAAGARARLSRALRFRTLVACDSAVAAAAFAGRVGLASYGFGAWSLVLGDLAAALVGVILLWACAPRPEPGTDRALEGDGLRVVGTRAADACFTQADRLFVGSALGAGALGLYGFALQHSLGLVRRLLLVLEQVALPVFSRLHHDRAPLVRAYLSMTRWYALAVLPAAALLWWLAPALVDWLYPARWLEAVPAIRALAVACACAAVNSDPGILWLALGLTRLRLTWSLANLAALALLLPWGLRHGLEGVAYALALRSLLAAAAGQALTRREAGVPHLAYLRALWPGLAAAAAVALLGRVF